MSCSYDFITKLGYNKTREKFSIFGILLKLLDSQIRVIITNCVYVAYILVLQWLQNGQLLVKRKRLSMVTFHDTAYFGWDITSTLDWLLYYKVSNSQFQMHWLEFRVWFCVTCFKTVLKTICNGISFFCGEIHYIM